MLWLLRENRPVQIVGGVASFIRPSHILLYARRVSFICRLPTTRTMRIKLVVDIWLERGKKNPPLTRREHRQNTMFAKTKNKLLNSFDNCGYTLAEPDTHGG